MWRATRFNSWPFVLPNIHEIYKYKSRSNKNNNNLDLGGVCVCVCVCDVM